jgi:hypothetical protein
VLQPAYGLAKQLQLLVTALSLLEHTNALLLLLLVLATVFTVPVALLCCLILLSASACPAATACRTSAC